MRYVLGSETELLRFTEHETKVEPVGMAHAVDPASPQNSAGGLLAYALCGTAVRAWPEYEFDPDGQRVHDRCATLTATVCFGADPGRAAAVTDPGTADCSATAPQV
jgi:hypothetical protein